MPLTLTIISVLISLLKVHPFLPTRILNPYTQVPAERLTMCDLPRWYQNETRLCCLPLSPSLTQLCGKNKKQHLIHLMAHFSGQPFSTTKGLWKVNKIPKIRDNFGSEWVGPGLSTKNWKIVKNSPILLLLICWGSVP